MTSEENLRMFMQDYHRALNNQNFEELAEFLDFPFEITLQGLKKSLTCLDDTVELAKAALKIQKQRGVERISRVVDFVHISDLREAIVGTREVAFNETGQPFLSWRCSYLLCRRNGLWRLKRANGKDHDDAWEKLGQGAFQAAAVSSLC